MVENDHIHEPSEMISEIEKTINQDYLQILFTDYKESLTNSIEDNKRRMECDNNIIQMLMHKFIDTGREDFSDQEIGDYIFDIDSLIKDVEITRCEYIVLERSMSARLFKNDLLTLKKEQFNAVQSRIQKLLSTYERLMQALTPERIEKIRQEVANGNIAVDASLSAENYVAHQDDLILKYQKMIKQMAK